MPPDPLDEHVPKHTWYPPFFWNMTFAPPPLSILFAWRPVCICIHTHYFRILRLGLGMGRIECIWPATGGPKCVPPSSPEICLCVLSERVLTWLHSLIFEPKWPALHTYTRLLGYQDVLSPPHLQTDDTSRPHESKLSFGECWLACIIFVA